jgi:hypothetical protein
MIDDPDKTDILISKIKSALPIDAGLTEALQRLLATRSPGMPIPTKCRMIDVMYLGDEGGVACRLDIDGPETKAQHIVSITHLTFDRRSPLYREIDAYQRHRVKKLKQQQGRGFRSLYTS